MNVMMKDVLIMMIIKRLMSNDERILRSLRPLNTSEGRDAIELAWRACDECL